MIEYPNLECAWQSLKTLIWRKEICDKYGRRGKKDGQNMLVKILMAIRSIFENSK